ELADALARLDGCGADSELVAVARRCLAVDPADRPADAGQVAADVAAYRADVDARLRTAERDRAAAEAAAAGERKRLRVVQWAAGLIAGVLVLGVVGTTIGLVRANAAAENERSAKTAAETAATAEMAAKVDAQNA